MCTILILLCAPPASMCSSSATQAQGAVSGSNVLLSKFDWNAPLAHPTGRDRGEIQEWVIIGQLQLLLASPLT
ncbi:hypothetical protein IAQ61_000296 [Plenodomus lingam]|uniref:uncharacterized protein n=1 Tax=Leptosphaeria maculans TaxID=5022 RepID=UPI0033174E7A|nr:hypothetical protein IAQ61_000296 [Plenodomus lingam]